MINQARQSIAELNKILGINAQNTIMINKNNQGDEQIVISFEK